LTFLHAVSHSKTASAPQDEIVRAEIIRLLQDAPSPMRTAALALLPAAKWAIDSGYHRAAGDKATLKGWRSLLTLLTSLATMRDDAAMLLQVSRNLLMIGDRMAPPEEVLRQSAEVLVRALGAHLYICRVRNREGGWDIQYCDAPGEDSIPMIPGVMEEDFSLHPVSQAIMRGEADFVVSNDLRPIEDGGQALDCAPYQRGYRSRLAFILREGGSRPPFGLILLYSKQESGFDDYDLDKFASIVSLTVGRRIAVARDTLEKASGAMAHFGNNALNVMRNQAEFCGELMASIEADLNRAQELSGAVLRHLPQDAPGRAQAEELANILHRSTDLSHLLKQLDGVLNGVSRMAKLINALKKSVEEPRLMPYIMGENVLKLE
jgi:hypothetical protein